MMHAAMIPGEMLEERRRLGQDKLDEVWEGVLHWVPPPTSIQKLVESRLVDALKLIARPRGLEVLHDPGIYDPRVPGQKSYRIPDLAVVARQHLAMRGIEGVAELAVEIVSGPDDESRDKVPFYARVGVREVWLLDQANQRIEVFVGTRPVMPQDGRVRAPSLGLLLYIESSTLHLQHGTDVYEVDIRSTL